MNHFETLQASFLWSVALHVTLGLSSDNIYHFFSLYELSRFLASKDLWSTSIACRTPTFFNNHFETLQASSSWSVDVHAAKVLWWNIFIILFGFVSLVIFEH